MKPDRDHSPLVIGIDCGTQSLRAALYRPDGFCLAAAAHPYPTSRPGVNRAEQNPEDWWHALKCCVRQCMEQARVHREEVAALACDGTSCTVVFSRADGRPIRPALLWMDIRAGLEAREVEATNDPVLRNCGGRVSAEWLLPKVMWINRHEPDVYNASHKIVDSADWLVHRLTGRWITSNSNAAAKRHWTPDGGWPSNLYAGVGLSEIDVRSPDDVVYLGQPAAPLLAEAADALGLSAKCVVSHAGMDGWTAPIGKGCFTPGCASLTLGTSTVLILETDAPKYIDGAMGPYPDGIRKGLWNYELGQTSGGSTIQWLMSILGSGRSGAELHQQLEIEARSVPAGSAGLVVFDAWRGNRTPYFDPDARGTILGLTLEHGPAHLYRAVLEGCAYGLRNVIELMDRGGCPIDVVRACGSGTANRLWLEIIAAVTGKPIQVSSEKHATCLGSAICAATAAGLYPTLEAAADKMAPQFETIYPDGHIHVYNECFGAYLRIYDKMKETMAGLARLSEKAFPEGVSS